MDDLELARISRDARRDPQSQPATAGSRAFFGRVTTVAPAVGKFINIIPQSILGAETEGATAAITDLGSTPIAAYLVGPGVPATGDQLVSRWADWRWVAKKPQSSTPSGITACGCTGIPTTLHGTYTYDQCPAIPGHPSVRTAFSFTLTWNGGSWRSGCILIGSDAGWGTGSCNVQTYALIAFDPTACGTIIFDAWFDDPTCTNVFTPASFITLSTNTCAPFSRLYNVTTFGGSHNTVLITS